jgi:hypothetical protein
MAHRRKKKENKEKRSGPKSPKTSPAGSPREKQTPGLRLIQNL